LGKAWFSDGGFYMGKSAETNSFRKENSRGILPYGSVLETDFFRGFVYLFIMKNADLTAFYSNNNPIPILTTIPWITSMYSAPLMITECTAQRKK